MMHRLARSTSAIFAILLVGAAVLVTACEKPREEDCKRAVANIRNLYGTANFVQGVPPNAAVRSCRGSASKESVRCIIDAKSVADLEACAGGGEFMEAMKGEAREATPTTPAQQQPQQAPAQQQPPPAAPTQEQPPAAPAQQAPAQQPAQQPPAGQAAE